MTIGIIENIETDNIELIAIKERLRIAIDGLINIYEQYGNSINLPSLVGLKKRVGEYKREVYAGLRALQ